MSGAVTDVGNTAAKALRGVLIFLAKITRKRLPCTYTPINIPPLSDPFAATRANNPPFQAITKGMYVYINR